MNRLTSEKRAQILHMLCEGNSIRSIERMTGCSKNTIVKLLVDAGKACAAYPDEHVRDVNTRRVQVDEICSFTYAKQKNVATATAAPAEAGDTWTWTAIDADSHRAEEPTPELQSLMRTQYAASGMNNKTDRT